jgi:transcriptional regulator with XRE-family HTH domain
MSGEIARGGPGRDPEVGSGELSPCGGLAELTVLARISASQPLSPIPDDVPAQIRVFAETLRVLFGALGMSLNRLAALLHSDPGTVSRYLSGKRIPPPGFIDGLCKAVYDAKGSLVTEQVHELVHGQFLVALQAHNPARYEVQRLSDLLQVAAQEKRQYEITVAALEEAIASRNDKIYELELEGRQLRSAWARTEGLFEEEKKHRERLQQAMDSLYTEVSTLKARLVSAQRRIAAAEERCWELEAQLDSAGARLPDEERGTTTPAPARGAAALPPRPQSPAPGQGRASNPPAVPHDRGLRALEEAAQLIRTYAVQFVPGLLQTEEYARAVILQGWPGLHPDEVERRVAVRMSRQKLLTREHPPRYWAILDEAALRRPMGGRDVLVQQVEWLIDLIAELNITVQVVPFQYGGHAPDGGTFTIMRLPETDLPDVVYMEYLTGEHFIDKPEEVSRYATVMERLSVAGTSPNRTGQILSRMLREI